MMIKTPDKAIAPVVTKTNLAECEEAVIKACEKVTTHNVEKAIVLSKVLREMLKLAKGESIGFDFGNKKEWKLSRVE